MLTKFGRLLANFAMNYGGNALMPMSYTNNTTVLAGTAVIPVYSIRQGGTRYVSPEYLLSAGVANTVYASDGTLGSGIIIGTGDTTPTENDTDLASRITSGFSATSPTITYNMDSENNKAIITLDFTLTNNSGESVTIKEWGATASSPSAASSGGSLVTSASGLAIVLIYRELFDTPLTIPAGEARTLRLSYEYDYSSMMSS